MKMFYKYDMTVIIVVVVIEHSLCLPASTPSTAARPDACQREVNIENALQACARGPPSGRVCGRAEFQVGLMSGWRGREMRARERRAGKQTLAEWRARKAR